MIPQSGASFSASLPAQSTYQCLGENDQVGALEIHLPPSSTVDLKEDDAFHSSPIPQLPPPPSFKVNAAATQIIGFKLSQLPPLKASESKAGLISARKVNIFCDQKAKQIVSSIFTRVRAVIHLINATEEATIAVETIYQSPFINYSLPTIHSLHKKITLITDNVKEVDQLVDEIPRYLDNPKYTPLSRLYQLREKEIKLINSNLEAFHERLMQEEINDETKKFLKNCLEMINLNLSSIKACMNQAANL